MAFLSNGEIGREICERFGVDPNQCTRAVLTLESGEPARVEFTLYPDVGQARGALDDLRVVLFEEAGSEPVATTPATGHQTKVADDGWWKHVRDVG